MVNCHPFHDNRWSCLVARRARINPAATNADGDRYSTPPIKEFVAWFKYPTTYGPTKPPRFPIELINPIDAAAAVPERKLVGNARSQES